MARHARTLLALTLYPRGRCSLVLAVRRLTAAEQVTLGRAAGAGQRHDRVTGDQHLLLHRARGRLDLARRGQLVVGDPQLAQLARADQHPALQRADRLVVAVDRRVQRRTDRVHVTAHRGQPGVELAGQLLDLAGVAGQRLLPPGVADRTQQRDQRRRRGDDHVPLERVLEQAGLLLQRRVEEHVRRDEADDELRARVEPLPVRLGRQLVDVRTQVPGVRREPGRPGRLVPGLGRLQEAGERDLRVDHHVLAAGQVHDEVGAEQAVHGAAGRLLGEVAVLQHAGGFHHPAQLQLAPAPADLRRAQGGDELRGLRTQLLGGLAHGGDLLQQGRVRALAAALDLADLRLDLAERLLDRPDQALDRLLALVQVAAGLGGRLLQPGLGQPDERLVVAGQRLAGQRRERVPQPLLAGPLGVQGGRRRRGLGLGHPGAVLGAVLLGAQPLGPGAQRVPLGHGSRRTAPAQRETGDQADHRGQRSQQQRGDVHRGIVTPAGRHPGQAARRVAGSGTDRLGP